MSKTFILADEGECLYAALRTVWEGDSSLRDLAGASSHIQVYTGGGVLLNPVYPHIQVLITDSQDLWAQAEIYQGQWLWFDLTVHDEGTDSTRVKAILKRAQALILSRGLSNADGRVGQIMRVGRVGANINLSNAGFIARGNKFQTRVLATQS